MVRHDGPGWRALAGSLFVLCCWAMPATRTVHVTVVTDKGSAVPDLTPADFEVKEDGKAREVLKAEPSTDLVSIAVLIDDRGSDINEIRSALAGFVSRLRGRAEVSLVSVVPTPSRVFDYTPSLPEMMAGIQRLVWRAGPAGGLILSAVADAADELKRREVARPAIVVVTFEGEEFRSHKPANIILAALERSGAALHVVAVGTPTMRKMNRAAVESGDVQGDDWTVDQSNRNAVLGEGPKQSGGRRQDLTAATGLTKALETVADDLLNQYAVVYAATDTKPSRKLSVSVKRRGVTVRAPAKTRG
jgi:VWFA-related protein